MKKLTIAIALAMIVSAGASIFAVTYENNEFQRKSRAYSELATKAYDQGDYDAAVEYARLAEENAILSSDFITKMIARAEAEAVLLKAHTRLAWAKDVNAEKFFPAAFQSASGAIDSGDQFFASEDYASAKAQAEIALNDLAGVKEVIPLPALYKVDNWDETRDCLWNIAKNPAVYGDPLLWSELYKANKANLKRPSNPNLLAPGMIVKIPSVKGEYREGMYDPSVKYESFKSQTSNR